MLRFYSVFRYSQYACASLSWMSVNNNFKIQVCSFSIHKNDSNNKNTNKPKLSKTKMQSFDSMLKNMNEASIESETETEPSNANTNDSKPNIKKKSSKLSNMTEELLREQHKKATFLLFNTDYESLFQRCLHLNEKNKEEGVLTLMNHLYTANLLTGVPFFFVCMSLISHGFILPSLMTEVILGYMCTRFVGSVPALGVKLNEHIVLYLHSKYPSLPECRWSRRLPDPNTQSIAETADSLAHKYAAYQRYQKMSDDKPFLKKLQSAKQGSYAKHIEHGWAYDMADNARHLLMLPVCVGVFHVCGIAPVIVTGISALLFGGTAATAGVAAVGVAGAAAAAGTSLTQYMVCYIGGAYMARLSAPLALRAIALPACEKRFRVHVDDRDD